MVICHEEESCKKLSGTHTPPTATYLLPKTPQKTRAGKALNKKYHVRVCTGRLLNFELPSNSSFASSFDDFRATVITEPLNGRSRIGDHTPIGEVPALGIDGSSIVVENDREINDVTPAAKCGKRALEAAEEPPTRKKLVAKLGI